MDPLFDDTARAAHLARAARAPALFLQEAVADEILDRLEEVNRTFRDVVVVTDWPQVWQPRLPGARLIPMTEVLPLEEASCDLVIHALSLHWANDVVGQIVQARRALRPDGLFLGTGLGGRTLQELRAALGQAETQVTGGLSPRVAPMADVRDSGALLQRAGLALPVADSTLYPVSYETPLALMRELRAMGEANAMTGRLKTFTRRAVMAEAMRLYSDHFGTEDGRVTATFEVVTLTGWAPSAEQPQPLRPGSAKTRLADALRVPERPLDPRGD